MLEIFWWRNEYGRHGYRDEVDQSLACTCKPLLANWRPKNRTALLIAKLYYKGTQLRLINTVEITPSISGVSRGCDGKCGSLMFKIKQNHLKTEAETNSETTSMSNILEKSTIPASEHNIDLTNSVALDRERTIPTKWPPHSNRSLVELRFIYIRFFLFVMYPI
jgi:hypothetical protein